MDGFDGYLLNELKHDPNIDWVEQQQVKRRVKRSINFYQTIKSSVSAAFNDPDWDKQWYMVSEKLSLFI